MKSSVIGETTTVTPVVLGAAGGTRAAVTVIGTYLNATELWLYTITGV